MCNFGKEPTTTQITVNSEQLGKSVMKSMYYLKQAINAENWQVLGGTPCFVYRKNRPPQSP